VASSLVILHWLRWKTGEGLDILIGRDLILGLGDRSILSPLMRLHLQANNITTLAQIRSMTGATPLPDVWMTNNDLLLSEPLASEWFRFTTALKSAEITLRVEPDVLLWAGGEKEGWHP